jgi:hypothetical protein
MVLDILRRMLREARKRGAKWTLLGERVVVTAGSMAKRAPAPRTAGVAVSAMGRTGGTAPNVRVSAIRCRSTGK